MIKNGSRDLKSLGKEQFMKMRATISGVEPELTELEYYCLCRMKEGYSVSYLARNVFNIHVVTLQKALTSIAFTTKLNEVNEAAEVITYQLCMNKLTDIILHSTNDAVVIQAIKTACSLMPQITFSELESVIKENSLTEDEAKELLSKFSNKEGVEDDKEEAR